MRQEERLEQMASEAFGSKEDMKFELLKASRVNNGLTQMMQELNITVPEAVDMWPRIGANVGKCFYSFSDHCLKTQLFEQGLGIFKL